MFIYKMDAIVVLVQHLVFFCANHEVYAVNRNDDVMVSTTIDIQSKTKLEEKRILEVKDLRFSPLSNHAHRLKRSLASADINIIIHMLNNLRSLVSASDMQFVSWDSNLQSAASRWTQQCQTNASLPLNRLSSSYVSFDGLKKTASSLAQINISGDFHTIVTAGPSSQYYNYLMASGLQAVGCAYSNCPSNDYAYIYICILAYGSIQDRSPGKTVYNTSGGACSTCLSGIYWCYQGLCRGDCNEELYLCDCSITCQNCATIDHEACQCICAYGWSGSQCEVFLGLPHYVSTVCTTTVTTHTTTTSSYNMVTNPPYGMYGNSGALPLWGGIIFACIVIFIIIASVCRCIVHRRQRFARASASTEQPSVANTLQYTNASDSVDAIENRRHYEIPGSTHPRFVLPPNYSMLYPVQSVAPPPYSFVIGCPPPGVNITAPPYALVAQNKDNDDLPIPEEHTDADIPDAVEETSTIHSENSVQTEILSSDRENVHDNPSSTIDNDFRNEVVVVANAPVDAIYDNVPLPVTSAMVVTGSIQSVNDGELPPYSRHHDSYASQLSTSPSSDVTEQHDGGRALASASYNNDAFTHSDKLTVPISRAETIQASIDDDHPSSSTEQNASTSSYDSTLHPTNSNQDHGSTAETTYDNVAFTNN